MLISIKECNVQILTPLNFKSRTNITPFCESFLSQLKQQVSWYRTKQEDHILQRKKMYITSRFRAIY